MACFPVIFVEKLTLIRSNKKFCGSKSLDHLHPHPHPHPNILILKYFLIL